MIFINKMVKTTQAAYYLMRHGYKLKLGAESVKSDMDGGINNINIPRTQKALEKGILKELCCNDILLKIESSSRVRAMETKNLLEKLYYEQTGLKIITDFDKDNGGSLEDIYSIANPYCKEQLPLDNKCRNRVLTEGGSEVYFFDLFSESIGKWGIRLAEEGVDEWTRLQMYFFSDPEIKGKKLISTEDFTTTISAYDKCRYFEEYHLRKCFNVPMTNVEWAFLMGKQNIRNNKKISPDEKENLMKKLEQDYIHEKKEISDALDFSKPKSVVGISHSSIVEPIIANIIASSNAKGKDREYSREFFYDVLKDVVKDIGHEQWGFTEYARINGHLEQKRSSGDKNIFIPENITGPRNLEYNLLK